MIDLRAPIATSKMHLLNGRVVESKSGVLIGWVQWRHRDKTPPVERQWYWAWNTSAAFDAWCDELGTAT